jgi:hypothetical protein
MLSPIRAAAKARSRRAKAQARAKSEELTEAMFHEKLAGLGRMPPGRKAAVACALLGHSRIVTTCFGYVSCARCGEQIGDTLGGCFDLTDCVIVGHGCDTCRANYAKLAWQDTVLTPDPALGTGE